MKRPGLASLPFWNELMLSKGWGIFDYITIQLRKIFTFVQCDLPKMNEKCLTF